MDSFNISLICLSLKYLRKNYNLISNISKWIYFELTKSNYKKSKFIKSLNVTDLETIKILIKFNKNKNLLSSYLINYCTDSTNYFDIVKLLIDNGADIHVMNDLPLKSASLRGHYDIVKLLIDNGANIHSEKDHALRFASQNGYIDIVKLLVANGANIHAKHEEVLRRAINNHQSEVIIFLRSLN